MTMALVLGRGIHQGGRRPAGDDQEKLASGTNKAR